MSGAVLICRRTKTFTSSTSRSTSSPLRCVPRMVGGSACRCMSTRSRSSRLTCSPTRASMIFCQAIAAAPIAVMSTYPAASGSTSASGESPGSSARRSGGSGLWAMALSISSFSGHGVRMAAPAATISRTVDSTSAQRCVHRSPRKAWLSRDATPRFMPPPPAGTAGRGALPAARRRTARVWPPPPPGRDAARGRDRGATAPSRRRTPGDLQAVRGSR